MRFQTDDGGSTNFTDSGRMSLAVRWKGHAVLLAVVAVVLFGENNGLAQGLIWVQTENPGLSDAAMAVAIHSSGLYVAGIDDHCCLLHGERWRIEKRSPVDGSIVWIRTSDPSIGVDHPRGIAVDDSGVYIVGFQSITQFNSQWRIEKRTLEDGSLIWAQTTNPSNWLDGASAVALDGSGLYVVGWDQSPGSESFRWRMQKRDLSSGVLLWSQTTDASGGRDIPHRVAVNGSGVYVVGVHAGPGDDGWRIEKRALSDGALVWAQVTNPSPNAFEEAWAVALDNSGLYVVGNDLASGNYEWRIEKRDLNDGNLIWAQPSNPSNNNDVESAYGVAVDGSGLYVVGNDAGEFGRDDWRWRIEKRNLSDGVLQWTETENPNTDAFTPDAPSALTVDDSGIYLVGWQSMTFGADKGWRIEKRDLGNRVKVSISVKPGDAPAAINPNSNGVIPVAILTTPEFDVSTVDPASVTFGPTGTETFAFTNTLEDVDGDGDLDLMLHFRAQGTGIVCTTEQVSLVGRTFGGQVIYGTAAIRTVGCK